MKLLHLANRNLWRNKRRSLITLGAITLGLASLIFIWGFIDGMNEQTIDNSTSYLTGHIKIHKSGFHNDKALHLATAHDLTLQKRIKDLSQVIAITPRLEGKAMLSGKEEARGVIVIGIDPTQEPEVTTIEKAVEMGRYLQAGDVNVILLGDRLADKAGLKVGEEAVLVTQARDGSLAADKYRVVGLYDSGIDMIDESHVFIPLQSAQELYSLWGQITAWSIRLDDRQHADSMANQLANDLGSDFEVLGWKQLLPEMVQMIRFHEVMSYIVVFIVVVVVAVGVANTILMAVMERTREFGVMLALGTSQTQIIQLVLLESFILGVVGLLFGNLFGLSITAYLGSSGIDLSQYTLAMETMPGLSGSVNPMIQFDHVLLVSVMTFLISILPALYPAWQVSRMQPVEAIHGNVKTGSHKIYKQGLQTRASASRFLFWKVAFRSIWRNPKRSALTTSATTFGLAAFLFLYAFTDGFFEQMIDNSIDFSTTHVQIEPQGFRDELSPKFYISQPESLIDKAKQHAAVVAIAPRIQVEAMISSPTKTEPLILNGVDVVLEPKVTRLHEVIIEGKYLQDNKRNDILLGRKLTEKLDVRLGEKVVITTQLADGSLGTAAYRLTGIFKTDNEIFDRTLGFVELSQAQELLAMQGQVSTIAMRLKQRDLSQHTANEINQYLTGTGYQAKSWEQVMPVLVQMIDFSRLSFYIVLIIVFAVVAIGIMNTLLMSVLERTREFGVMLALGTEPRFVIRMIVYESIILGALGILFGIVIGVSLVAYYSDSGVDLSGFTGVTGTIPGLTDVIYPMLIFSHLWLPTLVLFVTGIVAAFYPASRAARLEPVQAIHHV